MKIRHAIKLLLPTVQYGNVTLEAELEADLNDLEDKNRLDEFAACNSLVGGYTNILRSMVLQEVMEQKISIEEDLGIGDFKLNV